MMDKATEATAVACFERIYEHARECGLSFEDALAAARNAVRPILEDAARRDAGDGEWNTL